MQTDKKAKPLFAVIEATNGGAQVSRTAGELILLLLLVTRIVSCMNANLSAKHSRALGPRSEASLHGEMVKSVLALVTSTLFNNSQLNGRAEKVSFVEEPFTARLTSCLFLLAVRGVGRDFMEEP